MVASSAVTVNTDVEYGTAGGGALLLDAYSPGTGGEARPAVVLVHGGAWRGGDKSNLAVEARLLAAEGWVAFSVDYRLGSTPAFPAEVDDVQAAVRWVRAHAADYGVDPARIGALGASAGGHLVAMLASLGEGSLDTDARIRVGVSWSGPMDLTRLAGPGGVTSLTTGLLACTPSACPADWSKASPVSHVDPTDAPLLLINSTDELIPLDQAEEMSDRLQAAGVAHRLDALPGNRHAQEFGADAWRPTVDFLRAALLSAEAPAVAPPDSRPSTTRAPGAARSQRSDGRPAWEGVSAAVVVALLIAGLFFVRRRSRRSLPVA